MADRIVEAMTESSLRKVCRNDWAPDISTVLRWQDTDSAFAARCARAREIYIDSMVEETVEIADEAVPSTAMGSIDGGAVQDKKVRISARQWYAEKLAPKKYGTKVAIGGADDLPPIKTLSDEDLDARIAAKQRELNESRG